MGVLIGLALCSALAGFLITARSSWNHVPVHLVKATAGRVAVRATLCAVLVGGAVLALTVALARRQLGWFWLVISPDNLRVVILLSVLPAIFTSILASRFAAAFRIEPAIIGKAPSVSEESGGEVAQDLSWNPLPGMLVIALAGYLSPIFLPPKAPKLAGSWNATVSEPITAPGAEQPLAPSEGEESEAFYYEKPNGLKDADVSRWTIASTWTIQGVDDQGPIVFSPDGTHLAFGHSGRNDGQITIVDLYRKETIGRVVTPERAQQLAWDSKGGRLFYMAGGGCGLFVLNTDDHIRLPIPKGDDMPNGVAWWWADSEILFASDHSLFLDLDSLEVKEIDKSGKNQTSFRWLIDRILPLPSPELEQWRTKRKDRLASTNGFLLGFANSVNSYQAPNSLLTRSSWSLERGESDLVVVDQRVLAIHRLNAVRFERGNRYLSSDDGAIVALVADDRVTCHYMSLKDSAADRLLGVDVGKRRDVEVESEAVRSNVSDGVISVFVTGSIVNPLNGKTVAPDREQVKARARLVSWEGTHARFWIEDVFQPIRPGDVIADPHFWTGNGLESVAHPFDEDWWVALEELEFIDDGFELKRADVEEKQNRTSIEVVKEDPRKAIEVFVNRHHENATLGRLDDFVSDYASTGVDYFSNGIVDRAFIRKEHQGYQEKWTNISEIVKSPIGIENLPDNRYRAKYWMDFRQSETNGNWSSGIATITLVIESTDEGLKIVDQKAEVHNARSGTMKP